MIWPIDYSLVPLMPSYIFWFQQLLYDVHIYLLYFNLYLRHDMFLKFFPVDQL